LTVRLFVYGTLAPGDAAWPVLEPWVIGDPAPDAVVGRLYDTGRGYPAATLGDDSAATEGERSVESTHKSRSLVHGTVVTLDPDRAPFALDALDRYEGDEYARVAVHTQAGLEAVVYAWVAPLTGCREVAGGRWPAPARSLRNVADHSFARAWQTVAALAPDRTALVCGERRLTFAQFDDRAERLAHRLRAAGLGPDDKVAIMCVNATEYLEAFFGAQKLGCVPVNVNYRYVGSELAFLLDNSDAVALVFHDDFASTVGDALAALPSGRGPRVLLQVAHAPEGRAARLDGARDYDEELASVDPRDPASTREPSGDDLIFLYTGGTTGYPKAVMWRSDDLYVSLWQMARPGTEPPDVATSINAGKQAATLLPACPLMHGTGLFIALSTLSGGGSVVLLDTPRLDPEAVWTAIEREHVQVCTIVGDAFARPLLAALLAEPQRWDLSSLRAITSSGVTWSPETKRGLLAQLPNVTLIDSLGASEGIMTRTETRASDAIAPARFKAGDRLVVVTDDGEVVRPGDERIGMLGVGGPIPLGYYKDAEKTAETFRTVEGRRYSIPGDYATVDADGTIRLLGRGSACINTGGEKVYPEEVELALRSHPDVFDCVVVGVPDTRWGEMVVALVQPAGAMFGESDLAVHCRTTLAGYKVPKHFVSVDSLQRSPAGKADYKLLRRVAEEAVS
jgi:3-oxocholest-4-en-26-oate---CoA ligase